MSGNLSVLLVALMLAAAVSITAARAEGARPLAIDFFVDMSDDILADAGLEPGNDVVTDREIMIVGVPLKVGAREGAVDGGWHTVAGGTGRHRTILADGLAMTSTVELARADFIDDRAGRVVASAATDLRYAYGSWLLGLQPGVEISRWDTDVMQRDSVVDGRISRAIAGGLSLATTGRYRWRQMIGGEAADREIASGRIGIAGRLVDDARMDLAYVVRRETVSAGHGTVQPNGTLNAGPTVAVVLPLGGTMDLSANYEFTETTHHDAADPIRDGQSRQLHRLGLAASWDVGGHDFDVELAAAYRYECTSAIAGDEDSLRHRGSVTLAMPF